jgi:sec-independent protein translocase protein TatA
MPFGGLSIGELVLIFAVLLLLFGPKRLPELAAGVGKGIRDFKRSLNGLDDRPLSPPGAHTVYPAASSAPAPVITAPVPTATAPAPAPAEPAQSMAPPEQPLS